MESSMKTAEQSRAVPMEVLGLGLCRTGTQTLADALKILGYHDVYHMREVHKLGHTQSWMDAIDAKFANKGRVFGRAEYDAFLGDFMAVTDVPACLFPDDLVAAYPRAKVILTVRSEDEWYNSMMRSLWSHWTQDKTRSPVDGTVLNNPMEKLSDRYHEFLWKSNFEVYGREYYRQHNERVKSLMVERDADLLIYNVSRGWEPLCKFLGKDVPSGHAFPCSDDWATYGWAKPKTETAT